MKNVTLCGGSGTRSRFRLGSPKYRAVPVVKIGKCANGWNCPRPCEKSLSWRKPGILLLLGQCIRSYRHITAYTATLYCSMIGADRLFTQPRPKADLRDYLCCWSGCVGDGRRSRRPSRFKRHCPFAQRNYRFQLPVLMIGAVSPGAEPLTANRRASACMLDEVFPIGDGHTCADHWRRHRRARGRCSPATGGNRGRRV